jgi:cysteinyl-tRNA synthetase
MAMKYLGDTIDIHGGGLENVFPHHECEIAQSEAANDRPFVRFWLHNNMVTVDGVKMGKSLGNSITVKDALKEYSPLAMRFFVLSSHYRSPLDFSRDALQAAEKGYERIIQVFKRLSRVGTSAESDVDRELLTELVRTREQFEQAMNDDFNSPKAIGALFDFFRELNIRLDRSGDRLADTTLKQVFEFLEKTIGDVIGLLPENLEQETGDSAGKLAEVMNILLDLRNRLRRLKNFELADMIRDRLSEADIELKDTPKGTTWEQK